MLPMLSMLSLLPMLFNLNKLFYYQSHNLIDLIITLSLSDVKSKHVQCEAKETKEVAVLSKIYRLLHLAAKKVHVITEFNINIPSLD